MQTLPVPPPVPVPFATSGNRNNLPVSSGGAYGSASYLQGFPPETSIPLSEGGIPPSREDMNALGYAATWPQFFLQQGGYYTYSDSVASAIGGYPLGAILTYYNSSGREWRKLRSLIPNNFANFVTSPGVIGDAWEDVTPLIGGRKMFEFFWNFSKVPPAGALVLNGQILTNCHLATSPYHEFYTTGKTLAASNDIASKTMAEYIADLTTYGECNAFVFDQDESGVETQGCMRLPLIKHFIQAGEPGGIHSAGVPNITGTIKQKNPSGTTQGLFEGGGASATGAFDVTMQNQQYGADYGGSTPYVTEIDFDASESNPVYSNDIDTVQPASIELVPCIQYITETGVAPGSGISGITSAEARSIASAVVTSGGYEVTAPPTYIYGLVASQNTFIDKLIVGSASAGVIHASQSAGGSGVLFDFSWPNGATVGKSIVTSTPVVSNPWGVVGGTASYYLAYDELSAISGAFVYNPNTSQWTSAITHWDGSAWTSATGEEDNTVELTVTVNSSTGAVSCTMGDNLAADTWTISGTGGLVSSDTFIDANGSHSNSVNITLSGGTSGGTSTTVTKTHNIYDELEQLHAGYVYSLDSTTTSANIPVLSGGSYLEYTSPLSSLVVASVARTVRDSYLQFTLAAGGSVVISGTSSFDGEISMEGGKSYLIGIMNGIRAIQEIV